MGSWIDGAPTEQLYPGQDMGRPQRGPGALARPMRRLIAFCLDWFLIEGVFWALSQGPLSGVDTALVDSAQLVIFGSILYLLLALWGTQWGTSPWECRFSGWTGNPLVGLLP